LSSGALREFRLPPAHPMAKFESIFQNTDAGFEDVCVVGACAFTLGLIHYFLHNYIFTVEFVTQVLMLSAARTQIHASNWQG